MYDTVVVQARALCNTSMVRTQWQVLQQFTGAAAGPPSQAERAVMGADLMPLAVRWACALLRGAAGGAQILGLSAYRPPDGSSGVQYNARAAADPSRIPSFFTRR